MMKKTHLGTTPSGKKVWLEKLPHEYTNFSQGDHLYAAVLHEANHTRNNRAALHRAAASAASGSSHATRVTHARIKTTIRGRAHATKAKATDKQGDKINIDQLAKFFGLPDWDRIDELNQDNYWEAARGVEDEDAQMEAQSKAAEEVYRQWYDAIEHTAEKMLAEHGLELLAMKHTRKVNQNYRPHQLKIIPTKSWDDAANKIRETINGVGDFHFNDLSEFLRSGPYTAKQAVLSHLGYVKRHPDVYGGTSARQLYEHAWS